ncbi:Cof-type HAD-IIB family hydrolase [Ligilactobacillus sp. Marseille-Q7487]|uniref:Cof-type HAD-IIB family hydrolase n=1 Tax=Ligilactobacillus sp. Marseille-Q7487 TaxID=3022128 RepID=UPI0024A7F20E|nr:Cof-type HAD-IIB family hydrolase [Ligilactobacillus sp. Marseille-Q7487]
MIKAVAVDMDGTFLNSVKNYNRPKFAYLFDKMQQRNIKFIVASGNQYYQLRSYFPDHWNDITFIAENGAYILHGQEEIFCGAFKASALDTIFATLADLPEIKVGICGKKSAYVLATQDKAYIERLGFFCPRLQVIDNISQINDQLFKFTLSVPKNQTQKYQDYLNLKLAGNAVATSSGHGEIDLIIPGLNKAWGLNHVLKGWNLSAKDLAAFGDGGNDLEMLTLANHSYAMANSLPEVFKVAKHVAPSNDEDGVLDTLEILLH